MSTFSGHPTSYSSDHNYYSIASATYGETDSSSNNYATIRLANGSGVETYIYYLFDTSSIPQDATINSVSCTCKCYISQTSSRYISARTVQLYSGTTAKGSATTVSNSTSVFNMSCGTWTRSELDNTSIKIYAKRASRNTSTNYYFRFYGATLTVEYTVDEAHPTVVTLDYNTAFVDIGDTFQLTATVLPAEATNKNVTWSSSNTSIATVSGGLITGISVGNAVITVTTVDGGLTDTCSITVTQPIETNVRVKQNGSWVKPSYIFVKKNGMWFETKTLRAKDQGSWEPTYVNNNYNTYGNPTISGTICTPNTSAKSFIYTREPFNPGNFTSWVIQTRIKFNTSVAWKDIMASVTSSGAQAYSIVIQRNTDSSNQGYGLYLSNNGSSWNITGNGPKGVIPTGTWYTFQLVCQKSGSNYLYKMGYPDTNDWTANLTKTTTPTFGYYISFGGGFSGVGSDCEIDLASTKIWIDGKLWWSAIE